MTFPTTLVNLILSVIIMILGIWAYFKRRSDIAASTPSTGKTQLLGKATAIPGVSLYIGIAFGLFAVSHALTLAGLAKSLESFIIAIRTLAYLLVIVAPARVLLKR